MTVGERVQEQMELRGLSQAELARRVGISQPAIFGLIHKNKRGSRYLHRIARELGTSAEYLEGETDDPNAETLDFEVSSVERDLLSHWRRLDPTDQSTVKSLLASLSRRSPADSVHSPKLDYKAGN